MKVIISGDLVQSRGYTPAALSQILDLLHEELATLSGASFKVFRGDSFQGSIAHPEDALLTVLRVRTAINSLALDGVKDLPDVRISIGIGSINLTRASLLESNGEAFQFSGTALDAMKDEHKRIALTTADAEINGEFATSFALLDSIMSKWSRASAEVVYYLILGHTEQEIATIIGISQSAVNARKKVAQWDSIKLLMARYHHVISKYIHRGK
ncbi:MAG: hypothetical protein ACI828_002658 [Flavobacteriales bacterium]|jgi:hypothetical protein